MTKQKVFFVLIVLTMLVILAGSLLVWKNKRLKNEPFHFVGLETAKQEIPFQMPEFKDPDFPENICNISDYGAVNDGVTKNTKAFTDAMNACAEKGGGIVLVPKGSWLTGPIHFKSNINLHIEKGAEVLFSTNFEDYLPVVFTRFEGIELYNYSPLVYAKDCTNVAITGEGTLNGQGIAWDKWNDRQDDAIYRLYQMAKENISVENRIFGTEEDALRQSFVQFVGCNNVLLKDVTIINSPMWTIHALYSENIHIRKVNVNTSGHNTDGLVIDSSKNVIVEDSYFRTGDDGISIKSGLDNDGWRVGKPSENIIIRNCRGKMGNSGVAIGSEMSGDVRNVFAYNCYFDDMDFAFRIKSAQSRGGTVENIWVKNINADDIHINVVELSMKYPASSVQLAEFDKRMPTLQNINISNVFCKEAKNAIKLMGTAEKFIENVSMENIEIKSSRALRLTYSKGVRIKRVNITSKYSPVFRFMDSQDIIVEDSSCAENMESCVSIEGDASKNINIKNNDFSKTPQKVIIKSGAKPEAALVE
ncbi:MAG: glycoside hydrolase family 28 protein [Patescibacteria group bacterium]